MGHSKKKETKPKETLCAENYVFNRQAQTHEHKHKDKYKHESVFTVFKNNLWLVLVMLAIPVVLGLIGRYITALVMQ